MAVSEVSVGSIAGVTIYTPHPDSSTYPTTTAVPPPFYPIPIPIRIRIRIRIRTRILIPPLSPTPPQVLDCFLVKYSAASQSSLPTHADQSLLSFTISLNDPEEYDGGGTYFKVGILKYSKL